MEVKFLIERGCVEALWRNSERALPAIPPPMIRMCFVSLDIVSGVVDDWAVKRDGNGALFMFWSESP